MARPLRIQGEGVYYHVIQRGIERKNIFQSIWDKERFLSYLETAHIRYKADIHCYVLMDNHYHLIIETKYPNLDKVMHYIDASYAIYYNTKHNRVGPLYQGRYKGIIIEHDEYLHYLSRYIHLNPVRAKLVNKPIDYDWSSYRYFTTKATPPQWLNVNSTLSMFKSKPQDSKESYKSFVEDGIGQETDIIRTNTIKGIILGDIEFLKTIKNQFVKDKCDPEVPMLKYIKAYSQPTLDRINKTINSKIIGNKNLIRKVNIYLARKYTQLTLKEIAKHFEDIQDAGVSTLVKRLEKERKENKNLNKTLNSIEKLLIAET